MDADTKALLQEILGHQLQGIMFHFDLMEQYLLKGNSQYCRLHKFQLMEEIKNHNCTTLTIIEKFGEIVEPLKPVKVEKTEIDDNIMSKWHEWEISTANLYEKAVLHMPTCNLWKWLHRSTIKELKLIKKYIQ